MARIVCALLLAAACDAPATGSFCPPLSPPRYRNFGSAFFATYCNPCHSVAAQNRFGAPGDMTFDTECDILMHLEEIDEQAAAGPKATNTEMPVFPGPVPLPPTLDQRERLGQFLACEKQKP